MSSCVNLCTTPLARDLCVTDDITESVDPIALVSAIPATIKPRRITVSYRWLPATGWVITQIAIKGWQTKKASNVWRQAIYVAPFDISIPPAWALQFAHDHLSAMVSHEKTQAADHS